MREYVALFLPRLEWAVLIYFLAVNGFYALLLLSSARDLWEHWRRTQAEQNWRLLRSDLVPRISVLVPAYNEATTIADSLQAILTIDYPALEVVVVNDGSGDGTLDVLKTAFALYPVHPIYQRLLPTQPVTALFRSRTHPHLVVADKENGGKADALNAALNLALGELVCAIDADTLIEPDAMQRMVRPFLQRTDVLASGGTIRVVNACEVRFGRVTTAHVPRSALAGMQTVEYLRAFLFGRVGWNRLGGNLIISGAFGLFRRHLVVASGGYARHSVGEDMELVIRLRRQARENGVPDRVEFTPDPVAWTEVPATAPVLSRQRERWHRGLTDAMWRHRRLLLNPRYGSLGLVSFPVFLLVEWLAPVVEFLALIGLIGGLSLGMIDWPFALLFWAVAYGFGSILSLLALLLEEIYQQRYPDFGDRVLLVIWSLVENLGYRQLTVWWRLKGIWRFLTGAREWGSMERRGFGPANPPASE